MYLNENLKKLNEQFNKMGIFFKLDGKIIRIIEEVPFFLNKHPELKDFFKKKYSMKFDNENLWYIGKVGVKLLKSRRIKTKPINSVEELKKKLGTYIEMINEIKLRDSIKNLFIKFPKFYEAPAAKIKHHAYKGGLLEHIIQVIDFSLAIIEQLDDDIIIERDLIIAGAILHDIGKINCYNYSNGFIDITDIFIEQEHIINGVKLLSQNIESEKLDNLIHIIASHHNTKEWGSPISPNSNEAWIIHCIENLSSKIG